MPPKKKSKAAKSFRNILAATRSNNNEQNTKEKPTSAGKPPESGKSSAGNRSHQCVKCGLKLPTAKILVSHTRSCTAKPASIHEEVKKLSDERNMAHRNGQVRPGGHLLYVPSMDRLSKDMEYYHALNGDAPVMEMENCNVEFDINNMEIKPTDDSDHEDHNDSGSVKLRDHSDDEQSVATMSKFFVDDDDEDFQESMFHLHITNDNKSQEQSDDQKPSSDLPPEAKYEWASSSLNYHKDNFQKDEVKERREDCSVVCPSLLASIDLLRILKLHSVSNLRLYDDVMNWASHHSHSGSCESPFAAEFISTRDKAIAKLSKLYGCKTLTPTVTTIRLTSRKAMVSVPSFHFRSVFEDLLDDQRFMRPENFSDSVCYEDGKFIGPKTRSGPDSLFDKNSHHILDDMSSGQLYMESCRRFAPADDDYACGIVLFIDKSHTDAFGALSVSPVQFTLASLKTDVMQHDWAWRVIGYVPNLSVGKGKNDSSKTSQKLQDEHNCLTVILDSFREMASRPYRANIFGKERNVRFWIHCVIGDTVGNNALCCHFGGSNATHPYRDCLCTGEQFTDINHFGKCQYVTAAEVADHVSKGTANTISKHNIRSCFADLPLSDEHYGIMGITPPECLHVFGVGLYKYAIEAVHDIIGLNGTNKKVKEQMDILFQNVAKSHGRQSDRDFPRWSNRFGINDKSRLTGTERRGNVFILLTVLHTSKGAEIMERRCTKQAFKVTLEGVKNALKLLLSFESWLLRPKSVKDVYNAEDNVKKLVKSLINNLPRQVNNGWQLPKFHTIAKFCRYMIRFGSCSCTDSGFCEMHHKVFVKFPGQNTQRRYSSFATQVAQRVFENAVMDRAIRVLEKKFARIKRNTYSRSDDPSTTEVDEVCQSKCTLTFNRIGNRYNLVNTQWTSKTRRELSIKVHVAISTNLSTSLFPYRDIFSFSSVKVTCFSEFKKKGIIYRASPWFHGEEWYDWCLCPFTVPGDPTRAGLYYCKIAGFVQFPPGFPTPKFRDEFFGDVDVDQIYSTIRSDPSRYKNLLSEYVDNDYYVLLDSSETEHVDSKVRKDFVSPFTMGRKEKYYFVNASLIEAPVLVMEDFGNKLGRKFYTALGYRKWHEHFFCA